MHDRPRHTLFIGPFPPPVHGQSLATKKLFDSLTASGLPVTALDTGEGAKGLWGSIRRIGRLLSTGFRILGPASNLYISVNSGGGIIFSLWFAAIGRVTKKRLILHHHVYRYIANHDRMMARLCKIAGPEAMHLANCEAMATELAQQYPSVQRKIGYGNASFVDRSLRGIPDRPERKRTIVLGHMSNLSIAKGVGRTIDLLRAGIAAGLDLKLVLAGPFAEPEAARIVSEAQSDLEDAINYRGPVFGSEKVKFFSDIDIFVFPTKYPNEAGPIVNLEALAAGAPVISYAQCCIPSTLENGGGIAVKPDENFDEEALRFISRFSAEPGKMSALARTRFDELERDQTEIELRLQNYLTKESGEMR